MQRGVKIVRLPEGPQWELPAPLNACKASVHDIDGPELWITNQYALSERPIKKLLNAFLNFENGHFKQVMGLYFEGEKNAFALT